jgi:hypothetical protein
MTRHGFDTGPGTQGGTALRNLARDISGYDCFAARQACFFSAIPPSFNFLANGITSNYTPLASIDCPLEIAYWKSSGHTPLTCCLYRGFNDSIASAACFGLSMLFDPLVDAVLAANANCVTGSVSLPQPGSSVIVISDYAAIYDPSINLLGFRGNDWGTEEAVKVLSPPMSGGRIMEEQVSTTLVNLWDCLCEGDSWQTNPAEIEVAIRNKKILLWNFVPFLRGGVASTGASGLPRSRRLWLLACWDWLRRFTSAVDASQVILAVNKGAIMDLRLGPSAPVQQSIPEKQLKEYFGKIARKQTCAQNASCQAPSYAPLTDGAGRTIPVFQVNHPASWSNRSRPLDNHCPKLKRILGLRTVERKDVVDFIE